MSDSKRTTTLSSFIKPLDESKWGDSVDAMHDYLTMLKKHAEIKAEKAQEQVAEHEVELAKLKQDRQKRRNYGTRTGIALQDGTDTNIES